MCLCVIRKFYVYLQPKIQPTKAYKTMSTSTLNNLLEYLYGTLSRSDMRWVADHLMEHANREEEYDLRPYTMEEINAMLDAAEADIAAGRTTPHTEAMRELDEKIARWKQEKYEMAEAV